MRRNRTYCSRASSTVSNFKRRPVLHGPCQRKSCGLFRAWPQLFLGLPCGLQSFPVPPGPFMLFFNALPETGGAQAARLIVHLEHCRVTVLFPGSRPGSHETGLYAQHPKYHGMEESVSAWGWKQMTDCWNYGGYEGKPVKIYVYSAADEVELWLNGKSCGLISGRQLSGISSGHPHEAGGRPAAQHAPSRQGYRPCGRLSQQQPFPSSVPAAFRHVPGRLPGCPSFGRPGLTCPYAPWRRRRNSTASSRYSLPSARSTASMPRGTVHRSKIR